MQNEIKPIAQSGLLSKYGIDVLGTTKAVVELYEMVADRPTGEALVLMAQQGRAFGVQFFASTSRFDMSVFLKDADRFGMDNEQAQCFVANLKIVDDKLESETDELLRIPR